MKHKSSYWHTLLQWAQCNFRCYFFRDWGWCNTTDTRFCMLLYALEGANVHYINRLTKIFLYKISTSF